jgi:hypothetical protein
MYVYRKNFVFLHKCMSASVGNTINHALPRLHDIEAISRDTLALGNLLAAQHRGQRRYEHVRRAGYQQRGGSGNLQRETWSTSTGSRRTSPTCPCRGAHTRCTRSRPTGASYCSRRTKRCSRSTRRTALRATTPTSAPPSTPR